MTTPTTEEEYDDNIPGAPGTIPNEEVMSNHPGYSTSDTHSGTPSYLTIGPRIIDEMMKIMWSSLISPQCSPIVHALLHKSWLTLSLEDPRRDQSTTLVREIVIDMTLSARIQRVGFNPHSAHLHDNQEYLWFMWLSAEQFRQFRNVEKKFATTGTVPGRKDTRGDSVH
eukprot:1047294-Amphidinium_carterae.1